MATINPYLCFNGNTEEVFDFYRSVFGGEFASKVRFSEMPSEKPMPEKAAKQIAHDPLPIGKENILMGSDTPEGFGPPLTMGNNFSVSISTESEAEAVKVFKGLSTGGKVTMPMGKAPWGAYFGMFTDKFGINWMV